MAGQQVYTDLRQIDELLSNITPRFDIDESRQFDIYHQAMLKWIEDVTRDLTIQNPDMRVELSSDITNTQPSEVLQRLSHTIPIVYSSPDRAFAQVFYFINIIRKDLGLEPMPTETQRRQIALPLISFYMSGFSAERAWFRYMYTTFGVVDDKHNFVNLYPVPYEIDYTLSIWARNYTTLYRLLERIVLQFRHNVMYFVVDFTPIHVSLGRQLVSLELTSVSDRSELEPGTPADRVLRTDVTLKVYAYLFLHGFIAKRAQRAVVDIKAD